MDPMELPLTYKGEQIGDARLEIDDSGIRVVGRIYDPEKAADILGPSVEHVSFGFDPDGAVSFDGIRREDVIYRGDNS